LDFSTDGSHFVTGDKDGNILIVQTISEVVDPNGETIQIYKTFSHEFRDNPEAEQSLLEYQHLPEELSEGKHLLQGHGGWINSVSFYPKSDRVVSCSKDKQIIIWSYNPRDAMNASLALGTVKSAETDRRQGKNYRHHADIIVGR